jgi:hypothetical protein
MEFKQYKRKHKPGSPNIEIMPLTEFIKNGGDIQKIIIHSSKWYIGSQSDYDNLYVAREIKNPGNMWFILKEAVDENLEPVETPETNNSRYISFEQATEALRNGKKITREYWKSKGMCAILLKAEQIPKDIPIYESYFWEKRSVSNRSYWAITTEQGDVQLWVPTNEDMLANDWYVIDEKNDTQQLLEKLNEEQKALKDNIQVTLNTKLPEDKSKHDLITLQVNAMVTYDLILTMRIKDLSQ